MQPRSEQQDEEERFKRLRSKHLHLKERVAELRGEKASIMRQLEEYDCKNVEHLKKKLDQEIKRRDDLRILCNKKLKEMESIL